jgi:hypothetical protein
MRHASRRRFGNADEPKKMVTIGDDQALRYAGQWHGPGNVLYAVSSNRGRVPEEVVERAIDDLKREIAGVRSLGKGRYQLGKGTFSKVEIDELRYMLRAFQQALSQHRAGPRKGSSDPALRRQIVDAMARAFFVSAWAQGEEEKPDFHERGYGGHGHGRGVELMEVAPATSASAKKHAKEIATRIERDNGKSLGELYAMAAEAPGRHSKDPNPYDFGHYIAMQSMGHGVSWYDDHPEFGMKDVPYAEFSDFDL